MLRSILLIFFLPVFLMADVEHSIGLIIHQAWGGENEFAERIKIAGDRLNWKTHKYDLNTFNKKACKDDWIFTMVPTKNVCKGRENYLVLFAPERGFFNKNGHLMKDYLDYTGFTTTYENIDLLLIDVKYNDDKIYPLRWYPTVQYHDYIKVEPSYLFYIIGHWGDRLMNQRYQDLQQRLSETHYARLFGNPRWGKKYGDAFQGNLPFDGKSVVKKISELGVCLVLHSEVHLKHGIPSSRIFEAAAASAVIISDLNPFVIEQFGDSALYIDQTLSGDEIFQQIDQHMKWIQEHPEEALEMARKSHQIFNNHFLLEQQLLDFAEWRSSKTQI